MKAAVCRDFGAPLQIEEVRLDPPGASEVRLRISTGAIAEEVVMHESQLVEFPASLSFECASLLARGTPTLAGMPPSGAKLPLELVDIADGATRIQGSKMGGGHLARDVPRLVRPHEEGRLELEDLIGGRYPLDRINEAGASVKCGEAIRDVVTFPDAAP